MKKGVIKMADETDEKQAYCCFVAVGDFRVVYGRSENRSG